MLLFQLYTFRLFLAQHVEPDGGDLCYVLALHSSRPVTLEPCTKLDAVVADAVIELAIKRGEQKNVSISCFCKRELKHTMVYIFVEDFQGNRIALSCTLSEKGQFGEFKRTRK